MNKFFSIFATSELSFHDQEEGEKVILILRAHIFTVLAPLVSILFAAFLPLFVKLAFGTEIALRGFDSIFLFVASALYAFLWLAGFYILMLYALNTVILTDKRVIENEQRGLFSRKVSELHLYRVQDVSVNLSGTIPTLLSFGDILVQTAAAEKEFTFKNIPRPEAVKDTIMRAANEHRLPSDSTAL